MSGLTRKQIVTDATLAVLVGVEEGTLVSYAEMTKGMHEYIRMNRLRKGEEELALMARKSSVSSVRYCSACGSSISGSAAYCDKCGEEQLDIHSFTTFQ